MSDDRFLPDARAVVNGSHAGHILAAFPTVHLSRINEQPTMADRTTRHATNPRLAGRSPTSASGRIERAFGYELMFGPSGIPEDLVPCRRCGPSPPDIKDVSRQRTSRERTRLPRAEPVAAAAVVRDWEGQYRGWNGAVKRLGRDPCAPLAKISPRGGPTRGHEVLKPSQSATATTATSIDAAPRALSRRQHASRVAPVVRTSSTRTTLCPTSPLLVHRARGGQTSASQFTPDPRSER